MMNPIALPDTQWLRRLLPVLAMVAAPVTIACALVVGAFVGAAMVSVRAHARRQ